MRGSPRSLPTALCSACGNVLPRPGAICEACAPEPSAPRAPAVRSPAAAAASGALPPRAAPAHPAAADRGPAPPATPAPMNAVDRPGLVTTLALLQAFFGAVSGLLAVGSLLAAADSGEMGVVALVFGVVAALCLACAQGLWTLEPRGRHLQLWLAGLWLVCIPVGTVLGGLILYYLFQPKMRALFQGRPPSLGLASE